jgi:uncharacterized protein (TIGR03086 family)
VTPVEQLESIVPSLNEMVERMWHGQLEYTTPCAEFTVHDLLDHMIVLGGAFAPMFRGEPVPEVTAPAVYGWVPVQEFTATMNDLVAAVNSPGAMDRSIDSPVGPVDGATFCRFVALGGLVHGWDLASALGKVWDPPTDMVAAVDSFARSAITDQVRASGAFAAEVAAPADASPLVQLVAFTGRAA